MTRDDASETTVGIEPSREPEPAAAPALSRRRRVLKVIEPACLVALPFSMLAMVMLHTPNFSLVSALLACATLVPFFLDFEVTRLRARDLMPIVVMSALCVAGRLVFAPVPAIKPVTAIVIVTALSFGRQTGFITGALAMLVSNIFFGQGPWTPWQMYGEGLIGYISGVLAEHGRLKGHVGWLCAYGFAMSYLYGFILDTWTYLGFVTPFSIQTALVTYGGGAIYNLGHALGTVVFLLPIAVPWTRKFDRVKRKYGLGGVDGSETPPVAAAGSARDGTT